MGCSLKAATLETARTESPAYGVEQRELLIDAERMAHLGICNVCLVRRLIRAGIGEVVEVGLWVSAMVRDRRTHVGVVTPRSSQGEPGTHGGRRGEGIMCSDCLDARTKKDSASVAMGAVPGLAQWLSWRRPRCRCLLSCPSWGLPHQLERKQTTLQRKVRGLLTKSTGNFDVFSHFVNITH